MSSLARSVIVIFAIIVLVWSFEDTRSDVIHEGQEPSSDSFDVHVMDEASCPVCQPCIYYNFSD